ncbi:hypothetical protein GCM10022262_41380 [Georgenia daeguensis]|uniref:Type II toxin-antitoxin system VapB family antitoxin n=1 Tax=Georgenia daeguensis TaxID=908355 RepID=A0ABP6UMN0_9MICO
MSGPVRPLLRSHAIAALRRVPLAARSARPDASPPESPAASTIPRVMFKAVGDGRPYPDHGLTTPREWAAVPPRQVRLDQLVTTKSTLDLRSLLSTDSTFYGDLFAHVVSWRGSLYLEDGLHRALRAALQQRLVLHARVLELDDEGRLREQV